MTSVGPRVAWVVSTPTPYRQRFFELLTSNEAIDAYVYFCAEKSPTHPWVVKESGTVRGEVGWGWSLPLPWGGGVLLAFNPGIVWAIARQKWDVVVVGGYNQPTMLGAFLACLVRRIPCIIHGESHLVRQRPWIVRALKRAFLFPLLRRAAAVLSTGTVSKRYWESVGIPADHIFTVANTPDVAYFRKEADKLADRRLEIRGQLGIPAESVVGIFVGRLLSLKGIDILLKGLAKVAPERRPLLLIVGDGPERERLEQLAGRESLPVQFAGFRQLEELPAYYAAADFFALPSRQEGWGVVVNEAMAAGLPVLLSDQVGAAYDLLEEGRNGFMVPTESVEGWRGVLEKCVAQRDSLRAMGAHSRTIIDSWTHEKSVEELLAAVGLAMKSRGRNALSRTG